jgi:DNA-binding beta-propeller fold protein YncE
VTTRGQIAEFDPAGNLLQVWSARGENNKWTTIHGLFLDHNNFVWTTGREQHQVLQFTRTGQLTMEIGKFNETAGSNDTERMGRPAEIFVSPTTNEVFVADGYTNRRVIVFDGKTGRYSRHWGAYGKPPDDKARNSLANDPTPPPQYNIPHGITGSRDGMIYLADRTNSRVQAFKQSGEFIKEVITRPGSGGAFSVALSHDPEEEFMYVTDGTQHRIWIVRRSSMEVVGQFSKEGREPGELGRPHNITVDGLGNIYVSEGDPGRRAQKFTFKGFGS